MKYTPPRPVSAAILTVVTAAFLSACGGGGDSTPAPTAAQSCAALQGVAVPAGSIGMPTSGAIVRSATLVLSTAANNPDGEYCAAVVAIQPVSPSADNIILQVNLPSTWNGKAVMSGNGGFGFALTGTGQPGFGIFVNSKLPTPLTQGFATFAADTGHQAQAIGGDADFAYNPEELSNYAGDYLKKSHDVATYLMNQRYGSLPKRMYFVGFSTGGREALRLAQLWPNDWDGISGGGTAWKQIELYSQYLRTGRAPYLQPGAWLDTNKTTLLYNAVMNQCDALDGVKDGIISNVAACQFDVQTLRCPAGADTGDTCLSDAQIATVNVWATPQVSVMLPSGVNSAAGYNVFAGSNLTGSMGPPPPPTNPPSSAGATNYYYGADFYTNFMAQTPGFDPLTADTVTFAPYQTRMFALSSMFDSTSGDLSKFNSHGGKLIMFHGLADVTVPTNTTTEYYDLLVSTMSQATVNTFVRFALIPGFGHGVGVFNPGADPVGMLDAWVEKGTPPDNQTMVDNNAATAGRSRPLCWFPTWPKYSGSGDVNLAASFSCVTQ